MPVAPIIFRKKYNIVPITLLCLVEGNTTANAFAIDINKKLTNSSYGKTTIVGNYWTEKPPKRHIHILAELPGSTAQEPNRPVRGIT
uniref:Uncharacterized protein n=1 Tax=Rhizophagus irregularis (strain DAOM 181602 / DAOM 197198 / MUCL 43194) TaxID=747089 RepID=U9T8Q2_RHIID